MQKNGRGGILDTDLTLFIKTNSKLTGRNPGDPEFGDDFLKLYPSWEKQKDQQQQQNHS